jgi:hypothetical protein
MVVCSTMLEGVIRNRLSKLCVKVCLMQNSEMRRVWEEKGYRLKKKSYVRRQIITYYIDTLHRLVHTAFLFVKIVRKSTRNDFLV